VIGIRHWQEVTLDVDRSKVTVVLDKSTIARMQAGEFTSSDDTNCNQTLIVIWLCVINKLQLKIYLICNVLFF